MSNLSSPLDVEASASSAQAKPLRLDRITAAQRELCLRIAANSLGGVVTGQAIAAPPETLGEFTKSIVSGAFVTLKRGDVLRACCGVLGKPMPVGAAISSAAVRSARDDQRAAAISPCELPFLTIEVTLLGPFYKVEASGEARANAIEVGKHGVTIERGQASSLLLPSVAVERGWDARQLLCALCSKAKLPTDAWQKEDAVLRIFEGAHIEGQLRDLLPEQLPTAHPAPLSMDQLVAYAQVVGQNISALLRGGTPSYVIPELPDLTVNALVLSMHWSQDGKSLIETQAETFQANAIQVSFRPGIALQSNLFQMSQHAANTLSQQQISGQLKIGLTLGFDPAMHGYGKAADLSGIDGKQRGLVISDPRHCGLAFDPEKTAEELRDELRTQLPVGSRDGAVHTVQCLTTLPQIICVTTPKPLVAEGARAPAVAGNFYPAEDAARRALVDSLCKSTVQKQKTLSAVVPHAGLKYSGKIAALVWQSIEIETGRTIVVVSPKHTAQGVNWAVCPCSSWSLSSTTFIPGDPELAGRIADSVDAFSLDSSAHSAEHGIEVQLPLLERIAPSNPVVGIAMHGGSWDDIRQAASQMAELLRSLEQPPLLIISSDMNHFADDAENRRRDRMALDCLADGDPEKLIEVCRRNEISMCGLVPAAFVMETLRQLGNNLHSKELGYSTSADSTGDKSRVVGYAGALLS
jgi:AmmeMemoRadiSam system protein B/AmmeMemoRadiSam system protein A